MLMMTKIGLLYSTAFPSGMKSTTKKRQAFVLVFHAEETGGIGCGAEKRRNHSVGCSGNDYSGEMNAGERIRKERIHNSVGQWD